MGLHVPNQTETPRQYARRQLYDLAHVLHHLSAERWDDLEERKAVLRGLHSYVNVLYDIANWVEDGACG